MTDAEAIHEDNISTNESENIRINIENPNYNTFSNVDVRKFNKFSNKSFGTKSFSNSSNTIV